VAHSTIALTGRGRGQWGKWGKAAPSKMLIIYLDVVLSETVRPLPLLLIT